MISEASPLRRLPAALDVRQAMYFDGVRYTIEMLDISYQRLADSLQVVAGTEEIGLLAPTILQDAWSFVDSANRLRVLNAQMPGAKKKAQGMQLLLRGLEPLEELRNSFQHLPGDINEHYEVGLPALGELHWWHWDSETRARYFLIVPGQIRSMRDLGGTTPPTGFASNPDHIVLRAFGSEADLAGCYRVVARFAASLEDALRAEFAEHDVRSGSDLLMTMALAAMDGPLEEGRS